MNDIILYEELSMNAHPAIRTQLYDGWVLRFADGYTNRANSVNPIYPSTISISDKIDFCEGYYVAQNLPVVFKLTPLSMQEIDGLLEKRGYEKVTPTNLMTTTLTDRFTCTNSVTISEKISEIWQENYFRLNSILDNQTQTAKIIQGNIQNKVVCAMLEEDGKVIACGLCVIERDYAGLYDIVVDSTFRSKGYGHKICTSLLNYAYQNGAKNAYLQVIADNDPAISLYKKLGFGENYQYWYRVKKFV